MADPVSLAVLGGVAASEGIKFLYAQAGDVIAAWQARRAERRKALEVPVEENEVLDGIAGAGEVDAAVVAEHEAALVALRDRLAPYARERQAVDVADEELARVVGELRALLEAAYGRRFTFRGEQREQTGTVVTVEQALDKVAGTAVGVEGDVGAAADVTVRQQASDIGPDGRVIGVKGRIGG